MQQALQTRVRPDISTHGHRIWDLTESTHVLPTYRHLCIGQTGKQKTYRLGLPQRTRYTSCADVYYESLSNAEEANWNDQWVPLNTIVYRLAAPFKTIVPGKSLRETKRSRDDLTAGESRS